MLLLSLAARRNQLHLHLTEFQRSACPYCPIRLPIAGKITAPLVCSLGVLVCSLQHQREIKHGIGDSFLSLKRCFGGPLFQHADSDIPGLFFDLFAFLKCLVASAC
jgi:hypothetical protein